MRRQASCHKKPMTIVKIIKTPIKVISKALDLYVKGVNNFTTAYNKPYLATEANSNCHGLPRSFSTSRLPDNDQSSVSALVRSISTTATRGIGDGNIDTAKMELKLYLNQHHQRQLLSCASRKAVLRSCSVGMGRIDEDRVSSFRDNDFILKSTLSVRDKY